MILLVALLAQGPGWSVSPASPAVGDTVRLVRVVPASAAVRPRLQPLSRSQTLEPLADPVALERDSALVVRYEVTFFAPGRQSIPMPPMELRYPTGRTDVVDGDTARVDVRSVLPGGDSVPPPKPSAAPLARDERRPMPLALLVSGVVLVTVGWAWLRRRVRVPRRVVPPVTSPLPVQLERWVAAGEARAAAAYAGEGLREVLARAAPEADRSLEGERVIAVLERTHPDWPLRELADVLRALERATFAPAVGEDVVSVARRADQLARDLATRGPAA
jgi:hypothetical protein